MSLFALAFAAHLLVAILGVGPVVAMATVSSHGAPTGEAAIERRKLLAMLSGWVAIAVGVMFVTGVLIEIGAGGSFHRTTWYRASVLLLAVLGALARIARRTVRGEALRDIASDIRRVARVSWAMCALVGAITLLMALQPG